jgi:hypothetical protein
LSADYEIYAAILEDRVDEAERKAADLEKRIRVARALTQDMFGFFYIPDALDGNYARIREVYSAKAKAETEWRAKHPQPA